MNLSGGNETDVREEVAAPLLERLGYKRGTENQISRELSLRYDRESLGRKKPNDPPLRGRADYVLSVAGAGRWVFEIKGPAFPLDLDAIEQAITYARHPEVAATYAALTNGVRFVIVRASQRADDQALLDIEVESIDTLVAATRSILSPASIRRDCAPPIVDVGAPLADGYRSFAEITGGYLTYRQFEYGANAPLHPAFDASFLELRDRIVGYRAAVEGGRVWRDAESRIKANVIWTAPREEVMKFAIDKRMVDAEYICLDDTISLDENNPSAFDVVGSLKIEEGEEIYNVLKWQSQSAGTTMQMVYTGLATGYLEGDAFKGRFLSNIDISLPIFPGLIISTYMRGDFSVTIR